MPKYLLASEIVDKVTERKSTMLLQDAIMLGDTLKKCNPFTWISEDGSCGCALGGALLASGVSADKFLDEVFNAPGGMSELPCIRANWPWLTRNIISEISHLYHCVARGEKTIEDVAAYVRTVEPPEHAPAEDPEPSPEEIDYLLGGYNDPAYERNGR